MVRPWWPRQETIPVRRSACPQHAALLHRHAWYRQCHGLLLTVHTNYDPKPGPELLAAAHPVCGRVVVDTRDHMMGRTVSVVSKALLKGQRVTVTRGEELPVSGSLD
uniref:60S ribosomal protein L13a, putative n=1 Tax=Arundo donax TaxID=35708 RepID=A0A0A9GAI6_ARUDO